MKCSICHEDYVAYVANLKCKHKFHYSCLAFWAHGNVFCPLCWHNIEHVSVTRE